MNEKKCSCSMDNKENFPVCKICGFNWKVGSEFLKSIPSNTDVCSECWGTKKHVVQTIEIKGIWTEIKEACPECKGTGKAPNEDVIREAFEKYQSENGTVHPLHLEALEFYDSSKITGSNKWDVVYFYAGYKSASSRIQELESENEALRCCGTCNSCSVVVKSETDDSFEWYICDMSEDWIHHDIMNHKCDNWQTKIK